MAITDLINKIILEDEFSGAFDKYNRRLDDADSKTGKLTARLQGMVGVGAVVGGTLVAAGAAVKELADRAVEAERSQTNLAVSAAAAAREFGDGVGSIQSWQQTVRDLGDELRVFGDKELNDASARLIDMTKRLGLTEEQMQVVLRRTADLSAGKTDLVGGIERVTAALRGEAESAEFLGLSLSETVIRNYAEAHGLVFQELSDGEKAQLRYQVLLDQTNALQGRAATFANTMAGEQAELIAKWERSSAVLGQQVLPLYQGAVEALGLLASQGSDDIGILTKAQAGFLAGLLTTGAVAVAVYARLVETVQNATNAITAILSGETPETGFFDAIGGGLADSAEIIGKVSEKYNQAFNQITAEYTKMGKVNEDFIEKSSQGIDAIGDSASEAVDATAAAAAELAKAYEDAEEQRVKITQRTTDRLAELEFTHAQRVQRIQEDIVRATAEAAAEAARAREEADSKLAERLAGIERDLASDRAAAVADFNNDVAQLNQRRQEAERDAARETASLERDLRQEIGDINQDLADDLNDRAFKAGQDRLKIIQNFGQRAVKLEQDIANRRKAIDDAFEQEFATADPFRRKILEFNRDEQIKQLGETEAAEKTALESQKNQALTELEDRVAQEAAVLEREATQKKERLRRETEDRKAAIQQQLTDQIAANESERVELERRLAEKQAQLDIAAVEEKAKLQQQHTEELAAIDEQEQAKAVKAQEALAREQKNYADRQALLKFQQEQELNAVQQQFNELESAEKDSHNRRLAETRRFSADMQRLNALAAAYGGGNGSGGSSAGFGANPGTINNFTFNNTGSSRAGNVRTGRSVLDALAGQA